MSDFRIAGSVADQETLAQIVRIAGYTANLHRVVSDHFAACPVHAKPALPKTPRKAAQEICVRGCIPAPPGRFHY